MFRRVSTLALLFLAGCRCDSNLQQLTPGQLRFTPERVSFAPTYVGSSSTRQVEVLNTEGASVDVEVSIGEPFSSDVSRISLARGEATTLTLTFAPSAVGLLGTLLKVGNLELEVEGDGRAFPLCSTENVCAAAHFDAETAQCVETSREDGASCETRCVIGGCASGVCTGQLKSCDDADLCTMDACNESSGCVHTPRSCPVPTNPCQAPTCDSATGCGVETVLDGTLCGADDCTASSVDVCIAGSCVPRQRPDLGRCVNRWVPTSIPVRFRHVMSFDSARRRLVVFGGRGTGSVTRDDTWEYDGTVWTQRLPVASPPAREAAAMSFDPVRRRSVLYGGQQSDDDTWEWDGTTWLRRVTSISPRARYGHVMAWDPLRQRTLLYGGASSSTLGDTWEWDGSRWLMKTPAHSPGPRQFAAMAWDPLRQRMVLFGGGFGGVFDDTWEWDGTDWTQRTLATRPPARLGASLAWNGVSNRLVLYGGNTDGFNVLQDQWEWDGTTWTQRQLTSRPVEAAAMVWDSAANRTRLFGGGTRFGARGDLWSFDGTTWVLTQAPWQLSRTDAALAWDSTRQRAVMFGGLIPLAGPVLPADDTWEWSAGDWQSTTPQTRPSPRDRHALAGTPSGVMLFGGADYGTDLDDTWLWNGSTWTRQTPALSPLPRRAHALATDSVRDRVVLFGGSDDLFDTWEWDGVSWTEAMPLTSPPPRDSHALAFDRARQRTVLFGGQRHGAFLDDTWEWDGSAWGLRTPSTAPSPRKQHTMAFDLGRQRTVLFGGVTPTRTSAETWEWDGAAWLQRQPTISPPPGPAWMVFDEQLQKIVLFDGNDVWVFLP